MKKVTYGVVILVVLAVAGYFVYSHLSFKKNVADYIRYTVADTLMEYPEDIEVKITSLQYKSKNKASGIKNYSVDATISWDGDTTGELDTTWEAKKGDIFNLIVSCDGCVPETPLDTEERMAKWTYIYSLTEPERMYLYGTISRDEADKRIAQAKKDKQQFWDLASDAFKKDDEEKQSEEQEPNNDEEEQNNKPEKNNTDQPTTELPFKNFTEREFFNPIISFYMEGTSDRYRVQLFSDNENVTVTEFPWAGANEGDIVREGNFKLVVENVAGKKREYTLNSEPMTINENKNHVFITAGTPSILVVSETMSSNSVGASLYYIHDGKLMQVKDADGNAGYGFLEGAFKQVGSSTYQMVNYYNFEGIWHFQDIQIDFETGIARETKSEELDFETGQAKYNEWKNEM